MKKLALVDIADLYNLHNGLANPRGMILEKFGALEELFVGLRDDRTSDGRLTPRAVTFMACEEYLPSATPQERYWEKTEQVWVREANARSQSTDVAMKFPRFRHVVVHVKDQVHLHYRREPGGRIVHSSKL